MSSESTPAGTTPDKPHTGPSVFQWMVWAFFAGMWGALFAFVGTLLSEAPETPPPVDALHGAATPAEMNERVAALLEAGRDALAQDQAFIDRMDLIVAGACLLSVLVAVLFVMLRRRRRAAPSGGITFFAIVALAIPPLAFAIGAKIKEDALLQASTVIEGISNPNTSPAVVSPGGRVRVDIPVSMQSFFGYHQVPSFKLRSAVAHRADGSRGPVTLADPEMTEGGREPDVTDLIPLMENVEPQASMTIPAESRLMGAVITISVSGRLAVIPQGSRQLGKPRDFEATTSFRVAGEEEVSFSAAFEKITDRMSNYILASLITAVVVLLTILIFKPGPRSEPEQGAEAAQHDSG